VANIRGTIGNDILKGTIGEDEILGLAGDDRIRGLSGDDILNGGDGVDTVRGGVGADTIDGGKGNDTLLGGEGIDQLTGGEGDDTIDGGRGADLMIGGLGDDTYIVENTGDRIRERRDQGIDNVSSSVDFTLTAHIENLTLTGTEKLNATGNRFNNSLTGNEANNVLRGLAGSDRLFGNGGDDTLDGGVEADLMSGGAGNDRYIVDNQGDNLTESAAQGTDIVESSVDFALGANLEELILTGTALAGTGNDLSNKITGNASNNTLLGGAGADDLIGGNGSDVLTGGDGLDRFTYGVTGATIETGTDTITDFVRNDDLLVLSRQTFGLTSANGTLLSAGEFQSVADDTQALNSGARIVFSRGSGNLFYNSDGAIAGFGAGGNFTRVGVTNLASTDILVA
jgi:Ca2+-binding RTX toxin-like protein